MENLKQASGEILAQLQPPKFVSGILCFVALAYKLFIFFSEQPVLFFFSVTAPKIC